VLRALLLDFDGVVVDTEVATFQSWRDIYAEHGVELALEDWLPVVGSGTSTSRGSVFDAVAHLERLTGRTLDREAVIARRTRRKAELYTAAPLLPGVRELLENAQARGVRTAIVTRNREERVAAQCANVGLDHAWDLVLCANEDPTRDKAEMYRRALELLGVAAGEAVAIEDSVSGVEAAKRAGLRCVAVPNEITRSADFSAADLVVPSLARLSLDDL
jgi:HAD superfamily hydrolase (TIGR01509 family)